MPAFCTTTAEGEVFSLAGYSPIKAVSSFATAKANSRLSA
jgi:hypothetical protein